jgi:hypothetical protein
MSQLSRQLFRANSPDSLRSRAKLNQFCGSLIEIDATSDNDWSLECIAAEGWNSGADAKR